METGEPEQRQEAWKEALRMWAESWARTGGVGWGRERPPVVWVQAGGADGKEAPREWVTNGPELEGSEGLEAQVWRAVTRPWEGRGAGGSWPGRDTGEAKQEDAGGAGTQGRSVGIQSPSRRLLCAHRLLPPPPRAEHTRERQSRDTRQASSRPSGHRPTQPLREGHPG